MPRVTVAQLQRAVEAVVKARRAVEAKERALVASLDRALQRLGYRVVAVPPASAPRLLLGRRRGPR
jgi:hypothetical protein